MTRRGLLFAGAGATAAAQQLAPVEELVNTFEMEAMARRKLSPALFAEIAGSRRDAFDRITLRPRMMVDTRKLDLSVELFGQRHFAPILVGPAAMLARFHAEGESAMAAGAAAGQAGLVLAERTSVPAGKIAAESPLWAQVDPAKPLETGARVLVVTLAGQAFDWAAFERLRDRAKRPVLLKGIMSAREAELAIERGAQGIIVSNYREPALAGMASPIEVLPDIATAVKKRVPILIDGSFRRGSDVLKAIALGARAVLVARPALWGLAAYGARGVQQVMEQLQTELARDMAMCGKVTLDQLGPDVVRIHRR